MRVGRAGSHSSLTPTTAHASDAERETYTPNEHDTRSLGSNGGKWFKDTKGHDWFGKPGKGDAHELDRIGNEHAMAEIYNIASEEFGTKAPELRKGTINGKPYLMSRKVALSNTHAFDARQMKAFEDGFVIDAWLANWDSGASWQLAADTSGKPVRIDGGGGGLFRARGEPKGERFTDAVNELRTMRDPSIVTTHGFRGVTDADVKVQLTKFAAWYPAHRDQVDKAIDKTSMSPQAAAQLKAKLAARAQYLIAESQR